MMALRGVHGPLNSTPNATWALKSRLRHQKRAHWGWVESWSGGDWDFVVTDDATGHTVYFKEVTPHDGE